MTYFIVFVLILLIGVIVYVTYNSKRVSWSESFSPNESEPYGTQVIFNLMQNIRGTQLFTQIADSVHSELPQDPTDKKDSYIFIGNSFYGDSADVETILKFVSAGNNAFFLCNSPNNLLFDSLLRSPVAQLEEIELYESDFESPYDDDYFSDQKKRIYTVEDSTITVYLKNNGRQCCDYDMSYIYAFEKNMRSWLYFKDGLKTWNGEPTEVMGSFDEDYNNYIRFKYGQGEIYMHSTPLVFTNYHMLNDTAMNYCRQALSHFGDGNIYWDEDNRIFDFKSTPPSSADNDPAKPSEGPLEFILSEPSLRKAWYLLLSAVLLYLVFGARRKQRIIANMEKMDNTSIEYAEVLSQMFMKQSDHRKLVLMKMELLKSYLRDKYNIRLPQRFEEENEKLYADISQKSGVRVEIIKEIFKANVYHSSVLEVNTEELLKFHQMLEHFYLNCK